MFPTAEKRSSVSLNNKKISKSIERSQKSDRIILKKFLSSGYYIDIIQLSQW